jgi:RND family efflux transporter MFP subunit
MKTYLSIILTLALTFSCVAQNFQLAQAAAEPFSSSIHRTGKLTFKHISILSFKTAGYLQRLTVDEGDRFEQGDVLATLDTAELIEDKNAKYASLLQAKRDVARLTKLLKKELSAKQALDDAKTRLEQARAAYRASYYNLQKAQIIAPFSGIVVKRFTQQNEMQSPSKPVLSVAALAKNWVVRVTLTEAEIQKITLHQNVRVLVKNQPELTGTIAKIPAIADEQTGMFTIEIALPEFTYKQGIIAGQIADVILGVDDKSLVYQVPLKALVGMTENGKAIILTQTNSADLPVKKFYSIAQLDSQFVYLFADNPNTSIQYVAQGWQHLIAKGQ